MKSYIDKKEKFKNLAFAGLVAVGSVYILRGIDRNNKSIYNYEKMYLNEALTKLNGLDDFNTDIIKFKKDSNLVYIFGEKEKDFIKDYGAFTYKFPTETKADKENYKYLIKESKLTRIVENEYYPAKVIRNLTNLVINEKPLSWTYCSKGEVDEIWSSLNNTSTEQLSM